MLSTVLKRVEAEIEASIEPSPPLSREWQQAEKNLGSDRLRIMHWNILAQALSHGNLLENRYLTRVRPELMSLERRRWYLLRELLQYSPDVICLNEVDIFQFFVEHLGQAGYSGIFVPKPRSPCLHFENNQGPDGTAVFYNTSKLELVESETGRLMEADLPESQSGAQVVAIVKLRHLQSGQELHVAATHLKAKVPNWHLRQLQTEALIAKLNQRVPPDTPLVLCGDFNGESFEEFYSTLANSSLGLASAYKQFNNREPAYTTCKIVGSPGQDSCIARAIDFIWYRRLRLSALLAIPPIDQLGETCLPNAAFPSDHLNLCVDFYL